MPYGISPDVLALKPSDVLDQLIQNRQLKAEYDRMQMQEHLARMQEQAAMRRQRASIVAQKTLEQMSQTGAMSRLEKQLAAEAAKRQAWEPATEEEWMRTEGLRYRETPERLSTKDIIAKKLEVDPTGNSLTDAEKQYLGIYQKPEEPNIPLEDILYETKETTPITPIGARDIVSPSILEPTEAPPIPPIPTPVKTTRKRTKEEAMRKGSKLGMKPEALSVLLGREYKPPKEEKPAITPSQALSILSDPMKARQLKSKYPDTYKQLEDMVKEAFGKTILSPTEINVLDTNW